MSKSRVSPKAREFVAGLRQSAPSEDGSSALYEKICNERQSYQQTLQEARRNHPVIVPWFCYVQERLVRFFEAETMRDVAMLAPYIAAARSRWKTACETRAQAHVNFQYIMSGTAEFHQATKPKPAPRTGAAGALSRH